MKITTRIRNRLSDLLHDASVKLVPLPEPCYGVRIVHDGDYQPPEWDGNASAEEREAWADERMKIANGTYVALGMIVVRRCPVCGDVDEAPNSTALWGIVVVPSPDLRIGTDLNAADTFDLTRLADPYLRSTAAELIAEEMAR